jgi:uncharacterized protein (DUF302 family)
MEPNQIIIESQSPFGFADTLERLTRSVEQKGWKLPAVHNLQQTLANAGKDVLPVSVLAICHPAHSGRILEKDAERSVSALMPCRISVYEQSDGKTYISRLNAGVMAGAFGGIVETVMNETTQDVEDIITNALK